MAPHGVSIVGRPVEAEISPGSIDQHLSRSYPLVLECWTSARTKRGKQKESKAKEREGREGKVQVEERKETEEGCK